ncbi:hypothetical protein HRU87_05000 [Aquiluna borgnonia]|uniref:Ferritin-like domain-containing protein n=1 Tax=Aquiluna borgnonia TaxID=2499157 RepID=A0A7D4TUK4_9MICO|nr:ferritin-like fold-containing protein [Aquiluna borgnonia]QKJ25535.1 hypothetical protein HRU87_05000 [Aquiluna borgnonia]
MLDWLRRLRKVSQKLSLPSRDTGAGRSQVQLNPSKLTPSPEIYLGQLSVLTLAIAERLDHQSETVSDQALSKKLHKLSNSYYARHAELTALVSKQGLFSEISHQHFASRLDFALARIQGTDSLEDLMLDYIAFGMLESHYRNLVKGLAPSKRIRVEELLSDGALETTLQEALIQAIEDDARVGHRLAMYGRMIVADVLLEIRDSVNLDKVLTPLPNLTPTELARTQFKALEPYTSELIAQHTVRMDRLGLTA